MLGIGGIGVWANIHLGGGQTEFCPNGFSGGGVVTEIFRDPYSVGGGVVASNRDPKFVLFKHVLCFARIMSTLCPNSCRQTARIGGQLPPCPPSRTPMIGGALAVFHDVIQYRAKVEPYMGPDWQ